MSYEKQTWQTGDVITASKLNHMEDGITQGGGIFVVPVNALYDIRGEHATYTSTVSYDTVCNALDNNQLVVLSVKSTTQGSEHYMMGTYYFAIDRRPSETPFLQFMDMNNSELFFSATGISNQAPE